jgi:hypothetical protein
MSGREDERDEEGSYSDESPIDRPNLAELRAAAEIVIYLEAELGVDVRRLRVRVRDGLVHLQGSVASREQRAEIEANLPHRPGVRELESYLTVNEED